MANRMAEVAAETQATDISIIDLRGLVFYTDAFVLCSARNRRQMVAIAEAVRMDFKARSGKYPLAVEGLEGSKWVLVDFGDVVMHIFDAEMRGFYDLDGLWQDAPRLALPASVTAHDSAAEPTYF